jgi:LysM repeat protein
MSYRIQSGDTLSGIAARFHVSLGALEQANPQIHNPNLIYAGAALNVPGSTDSFQPAPSKPAAPPASNGAYTVRSGDSMSAIASRNGISLSALERANPQVTNPNLIRVGQRLNIPGRSGTVGAPPPVSAPPPAVGSGGGSSAAFNIARSVLGTNISSLKYSGPLAQYLDKWPGNNVCCANFVSACLEKAGQIQHSEHNDNVSGLANNLAHDSRWNRSSLANAQPGDVVCFDVPGEGHMAHVVMFAGWKNGQPTFIGSNNANPDGSQRITEGYMNYSVDAVYHFHG